jgi:hypothetical protein
MGIPTGSKEDPRQPDWQSVLGRHLDGDFFVVPAGQSAASLLTLRDFQTKSGIKLPDDFVSFCTSAWGQVRVEVKEAVWPRPKAYEVGPFWTFLYAMHVYGFSAEAPDWMDLPRAMRDLDRPGYAPFLKVEGDADVYCFDRDGKVTRWDHELDEFAVMAETFTEVYEAELSALRKRKDDRLRLLR